MEKEKKKVIKLIWRTLKNKKMKLFLLVFSISTLSSFRIVENLFPSRRNHQLYGYNCKQKINKAFTLTINKNKNEIHGGYYCQLMCDLLFSNECKIEINTKLDLLIGLIYFQERNIQTVFYYSTLKKINEIDYSLLMIFAPLKVCPDSLLNIKPKQIFLNKLDSNHLNFVLKTDSLIKHVHNMDSLNDNYYNLVGKSMCQDWYFGKYKKYFVNW